MSFLDNLLSSFGTILPKLPIALFDLLVGVVLIQLATVIIRHSIRLLRIPRDLRGLIITASKFAMWIFLIIYLTSVLGLGNLALLLSGSAVVLVFFLNNSIGPLLADIFSGLALISDPDFTVGMRVIVNDGGTTGTVKGIDMRKVRIWGDDGKMHIVPNSVVEKSTWTILERKQEPVKTKMGRK